MSLVKEFKKGNEIVRLFNSQINGSEVIKMNGKLYWMMREKSEGVNRWSKSEINDEVGYKKCENCKCKKNVKFFYVSKNSEDGYSKNCGSCDSSIVSLNKNFNNSKRLVSEGV